MYLYQSFYDFNVLIQEYQNNNIKSFEDKFTIIFNATPQMVEEQMVIINEILEENLNTHNYISQILIENVNDIRNGPALEKLENLISELEFAKIAYKEDFEKSSSQIDDIENIVLEWQRLVELNKKLCVFMFNKQFEIIKPMIEMLIQAKNILTDNLEKISPSLQALYKNREENLKLYNTIFAMVDNANKIYKNYDCS